MLAQDLHDIYELIYKYQVLSREAKYGGWGVPQVLNDRAQLELIKISDRLRRILVKACHEMVLAFNDWVIEHESVIMTDAITDFESILEESSTAERSELTGIPIEKIEGMSIDQIIRSMDQSILNSIVEESTEMAKVRDASTLTQRLEKADSDDVDKLILLFQEALHYAHFNGLLAEKYKFLEDVPLSEVQGFLKSLSTADTARWDRDMAKLLGYEPGSRLRTKESRLLAIAVDLIRLQQ